MPGQRRGGPPDRKGTLGSLFRTTLEQVGLVKDAVERQAKSQRVWLDSALLHRKHREALTALGEVVYTLAASGDLGDLEEYPEIARQLAILGELEQRIAETAERAREATENARQAAERFVQRATWPAAEVRRRVWHRPDDNRDWRAAAGFPDWNQVDDEDPFDQDPFDQPQPPPAPPRSPRSQSRRRATGGGGIAYTEPAEPARDKKEVAAFVEADFGGDSGGDDFGGPDDDLEVVALGDHLHSSGDLAATPDPAPPLEPTVADPALRPTRDGDNTAKPRAGRGRPPDPEN